MMALFRKILSLPKPWNFIAFIILFVLILSGILWTFSAMSSCGYRTARQEYQAAEDSARAERERLIGQIQERDKAIAALQLQKQVLVVLAEQGVKLDQEKKAQIENITAKEAADLEDNKLPIDCRVLAERTVALLLTAKPPIKLNLASVIKQQCAR